MIKRTIYLSGPITDPQTNQPREGWEKPFNALENHLRQQGLDVINPVDFARHLDILRGENAPKRTRADYLIADLQLMLTAATSGELAGILMMNGWETSDGAQCEYHFARSLGIPVFSQYDNGFQLNRLRRPFAPADGKRDILKWYTLAELAAAVRDDVDADDNNQRPAISYLRKCFMEQEESCADELA